MQPGERVENNNGELSAQRPPAEPPSAAKFNRRKQRGDERSPSGNSSSTEMVPPVASLSGEKRQQHQLGEHRQQPAPASNISKCRRHPRENNDAVPNGQQPLPPPSLFSDQQL
ncbi:hypothetical protein H5410_001002 [Solanum commersonii]|uniref:Uncharacterized protein n=1 Tax=Solanum commersonii TaxID=4109 RepID=A0A9J6AXE9_SOLCO|nr:hypothetical protein H5410_001002 [Solanum commersonii]